MKLSLTMVEIENKASQKHRFFGFFDCKETGLKYFSEAVHDSLSSRMVYKIFADHNPKTLENNIRKNTEDSEDYIWYTDMLKVLLLNLQSDLQYDYFKAPYVCKPLFYMEVDLSREFLDYKPYLKNDIKVHIEFGLT